MNDNLLTVPFTRTRAPGWLLAFRKEIDDKIWPELRLIHRECHLQSWRGQLAQI